MSDFSSKQRKQIDQAAKVLQPGEVVLDVTTGVIKVVRMGSKKSRNGAILVTDRRVIFYSKKIGGYEMYDHVYGLLSAIDYKKGMFFGSITLAASGDSAHVSQIPKDDVERIAKAIRERIAEAHEQGQPRTDAPVNAMDEIRKLSELHDAGILTDDEFTAKKKQLLGL
jgi:hypothetical protein